MARHEKEIGRLSGFNYRALGQVWQNSERYDNAFIWWFRASAEFAKIEDDKLTRFCLSKAKNCLDRIESGSDLSTGVIGDYQKLLADLPDAYKIEKDLVDASIKQVLAKKP